MYGLLSTYTNLRPDALQAATAARLQVTGFITNDPVFQRVTEFQTLLFDQLV